MLLFGPTGSNLVQTYFMQDNSVIVSVITKIYDFSVIINAASMNVFLLQFFGNFTHRKFGGGFVDINYYLRNIERGINCVKNQKWP